MSKFKVGDKVREVAVDGKSIGMQGHWDRYWSSREGPVKDGIFTITRVLDGGYYEYSNKIDGEGPQAGGRHFELAEPTTQTPQPSFIKTVPARREIAYGVHQLNNGEFCLYEQDYGTQGVLGLRYDKFGHTVKDLREAAVIFNQIADVLEENSNA